MMRTTLIALAAFCLLSACDDKITIHAAPNDSATPTPAPNDSATPTQAPTITESVTESALDYAIIDNLSTKFITRERTDLSDAQVDCELTKIAAIKKWAKALDDRRVRGKYLEWLDFYERRMRANRGRKTPIEPYPGAAQVEIDLRTAAELAPRLPQPPDVHAQCEPGQ